jgi:ABC-type branched-subunit amino acid transport system substrate-binding protein
MKTTTIVAIIVVIVITAAGSFYAYETYYNTTSTASTINIGIMENETGSIAAFAKETIAMAEVAVSQINAEGGILGHHVKLFVANELPDPISAVQSLVLQDNIIALIGVSYSGDAIAVMPFLSSHGVIGMFTTSTSNTLMNNVTSDYTHFKYFFRVTLQDSTYAQSLGTFFSSVTKPSSIYFVAEDLSFAHETFAAINSTAHQMGIQVLGATFVPLSQTDFSSLAAQIASLHPSMIIDAQTGIGGATFIEQLKANPAARGIEFMDIANGALSDPYVMSSVESSNPGVLNGTIFQQFPGTNSTPYNSVGASLAQAYTQNTGQIYYSFPSNSYTAIRVLQSAISSANSLNVNSIISALEKVSYQGPTGLVTFDSNHNWIVPGLWYTQFQNGKLQVIWPSQYATSTYQSPS